MDDTSFSKQRETGGQGTTDARDHNIEARNATSGHDCIHALILTFQDDVAHNGSRR